MICQICGAENPPDFCYCGRCGEALPQLCPLCGLENLPGQESCVHCGGALVQNTPISMQALMEGERRFVVILFADIAGFTRLSAELDPEETVLLLNRCLDEMTRSVVQHGGRLDKYTGDGLMAIFGAPLSHEDDPERALQAALDMQRALAQMQIELSLPHIELHIGLACGLVVAAGIGGQGRKEYTTIGTPVNLAARLEDASTIGQILVNEDLARLGEQKFNFRPLVLDLQGFEGETKVYELLDRRSGGPLLRRSGPLQAPIIARTEELALFQRQFENLANGSGGILSIIGDVGIGKSRLVRETRLRLEQSQITVKWLAGSALESGVTHRYGCLQSLVRSALEPALEETGNLGECFQCHLQELLAERAEETYLYLGQLLGIPLDALDRERLAWMEPERLTSHTARLFRDWLEALSRQQPLVLVFEDLHWADPASVEFIDLILPVIEQAPVLLILVFRPEQDRPFWKLRSLAAGAYPDRYSEVWLKLLPPAAVETLVSKLLGAVQPPRRALELIMNRTEGNPLFIEEIVQSMLDQGALIQQDESRWDIAPDWSEVSVPDTIQGILQARIDRLDRDAKRVLQVAACAGRRFSLPLLLDIGPGVGIPKNTLQPRLRTLEEAGLIQRMADTRPVVENARLQQEYTFRHVLIRDIVHSSLLRANRTQIHAAIAEWYENQPFSESSPPYALLAYHYDQANDTDKQREYYVKAGRHAAQSYANQEASDYYARALKLMIEESERIPLLLEWEKVLFLLGDLAQRKIVLDELLQLAGSERNEALMASIYNRMANWHESQSNYSMSRTVFMQALEVAQRSGDRHAEAESRLGIASAAWRLGQLEDALEAARQAIEVARICQDPAREATGLTTMGVVYRTLGRLDDARAGYTQALELRRGVQDWRGEAISLTQLGNVLYDQGCYSEAYDNFQQATNLFGKVGDVRGEAWSLGCLGSLYWQCGYFEAARSAAEEALAIRRSIGDRRGEAIVMSDMGSALLALGETEAAIDYHAKALDLLRQAGARVDEVETLTCLGIAYEKIGRFDQAGEAHQSAYELRQKLGQTHKEVDNLAGLARMAQQNQDLEQARTLCLQALTILRSGGLGYSRFPFLVYLTVFRILSAVNEQDLARQVLAEAYNALIERSRRITDLLLRESFLERVPEHRELLQTWQNKPVSK